MMRSMAVSAMVAGLLVPVMVRARDAAPSPPAAPVSPAVETAGGASGTAVAEDLSLPTTSPTAAPTTRPSIQELHAQAVALMREGKWSQAVAPMAKVYHSRPLDEQPRSVVLNQAILDVKMKVYAVRAVRDLTRYLTAHREMDELATNVLGSALDVIADRPRMRRNPIFLAGVKEWERRNAELEYSRPGSHRWGVEWLDNDGYEHHQKVRREHERKLADQQEVVDRAAWRFNIKMETYQGLLAEAQASQQQMSQIQGTFPQGTPVINGNAAMARAEARRMRPELEAAQNELNAEKKKLAEVKNNSPRPYWPREYAPVEPEER
jgi:hypothetical protein